MIQPDAKCINNGKKLNETIKGLNSILNNVVSEEIDIVDSNNQPSKRWFVIGKLTGQKQDSGTGDQNRLGNTPSNNNRDKLTPAAGGAVNQGAAVAPANNIGAGGAVAGGGGGGGGGGAVGGGARGGGGGSGSANMISVGGGGQPPASASTSSTPTAPTAPTPTTPTAPTTEPAPTTSTEVSPAPEPVREATTSTTGDTTDGNDSEFVDWRAAEKARIKSRMTAMKSRLSINSSPEQIAEVRESINRLIEEYDRVSKL